MFLDTTSLNFENNNCHIYLLNLQH